jgi:opacity protein-like surface antigen
MPKPVVIRILSALLWTAWLAPAAAGEGQIYGLIGYGSIGGSVVDFDTKDIQYGAGVALLGGEGLKIGLGLEVDAFNASETIAGVGVSLDVTLICVNLLVEAAGPIRPYVIGGVGAAHGDLRASLGPIDLGVDGYNFAYNLGGGIKLVTAGPLMLGGDFRWFQIPIEDQDVHAYRLAALVGLKF